MADNLLNTSIAALKTRVLNEITSANALDVLKLAQASKGSLLHNDTQIETAINTRINSLASSANAGDLKILGLALKQMLDTGASGGGGATTLDELTDVSTSGVANDKILKYNSSTSKWEVADESGGGGGASVSISDTAPSSPSAGDLWFDSTDASMKVYYSDGSSNQWVTTSGETGPTGAAGQDGQAGSAGADGGKAEVLTDMAALIAKTGMTSGDMALVNANNNLYIYNGSGWYKIATITNQSPSAITGVSGTYDLTTDGSPTTITAVTTDPEGFPLTWSYTTSGLGSIATVSNTDGVFTITPSTDTNNGGTFTLTISATDGVNGAVSATSNLTLEFIINVPNSRYTTMLATATSTGDNNDITDSSSYNRTLSVTGDICAGTFSPYRHGRYSMSFEDGTADYVNIAGSNNLYTAMDFGTDDYTVECWLYPKLTGNAFAFGFSDSSGTDSSVAFALRLNLSGNNMTIRFQNANDAGTLNLSLEHVGDYNNKWTHVAATRTGGYQKLYINGQEVHSQADASAHMRTPAHSFSIGRAGDRSAFYYKGYITDLRIVNGTAVYSANFTPPTERLTAVTNTSLLTCHLPYISKGDGSTNNFSFTSSGSVSPKPIGPYDYAEYSTTTHGGSINCPDSGAVKVPTNTDFAFGTGQFCIEFWWRPDASITAQGGLIDFRNSSGENNNTQLPAILIDNSPAVIHWTGNGNQISYATTNFIIGNWYHIAVSRDSSNNLSLYVNGSRENQTTNDTTSYIAPTTEMFIGNWYAVGTTGYSNSHTMSDIRIIKGSTGGREGSEFTLPTAPLTATSDTKLLIKGTDASIIDKSQTANLKLNNSAVGSTTYKIAGTNSIDLTSNDAHLSFSTDTSGLGVAFTMEGWIYLTQWNGYETIFHETGTSAYLAITQSGGSFEIYNPGVTQPIFNNCGFVLNTWFYWTICRDSAGAWYLFKDGNRITTGNSAINQNDLTAFADAGTGEFKIGSKNNNSTQDLSGYIQQFRITDGLARYTSNFTPPTELFKG